MSEKLTEPAYWDTFWRNPLGATASHLSFHYWALSKRLRAQCPKGSSALELGCGGSVWLPMLATHGADSWGIDYSDVGVLAARQTLSRWNVKATVVQGDVFDTEALPVAHFDLVYSLGLLEHFTDSTALVHRFVELAKPGGRVLTSVPNLAGVWGSLQRRLDRRVYDAHRVYTPAQLDDVHLAAGLEIVEPAGYFGGVSPLLVNYNSVLDPLPALAARGAVGALWLAQQAVNWGSAPLPAAISNPPSLAGHILGVYRRPA